MDETGLIHFYLGDGKGKTTAAIGLACRAVGAGKKVLFAQFLKGRATSELKSFEVLGIKVLRTEVKKFVTYMDENEKQECKVKQQECLWRIREMMTRYDLIVLDEILGAISLNMVGLNEVVELIQSKPKPAELVLTGRRASEQLVAMADYVSDIKCVKHPYEKGIQARCGIEF